VIVNRLEVAGMKVNLLAEIESVVGLISALLVGT
jgi:hypothetical protein